MTEIEKIKRYIDRTKIPTYVRDNYDIPVNQWNAMAQQRSFDAVCLAFEYGMAKGYRAAKAEGKA